MRYINLRLTYLLTYLHNSQSTSGGRPHGRHKQSGGHSHSLYHPSLLHSFTPGSKPTFSTNPPNLKI